MKRVLAFIRSWTVPAVLVGLAALLTVPWTFWVIAAAYERDVNEKAALIVKRVQIQLSTSWWNSPQRVLDQLTGELLGDNTVQVVSFLYVRPGEADKTVAYGHVYRNKSVPVPMSMEEIRRMLNADPNSYRMYSTWDIGPDVKGVIYLDLSRPALRQHFQEAYWPLLRNVMALTATGLIIISAVGIFAYQIWGRATRQKQRAELEQQGLLAERGLAAAVLAHEIRNPLAALRFQLHSLRRNASDNPRVNTTADTIDAELMRIQKLVQEYLAHEKAQAMRVEPVELAEAVRDLQTLMGELLRQSDTRMVIQGERRVVVACDPHALRQVLMNLVLNAQQAMGSGGLITIRIGQGDGFGTIAVADTGPGIPEELKDRLFKPFVTSKKEGSGIGLALVKRFADNFGGSVSVESEPGRGATFHIRLPLADARAGGVEEVRELGSEAITEFAQPHN